MHCRYNDMQDVLPPAASDDAARSALKARLKAGAIHLGLSLVIAAGAAALVFGLWYPSPFREISGGRELFFIVVAVDVVLGPLITLAVFDRRKPNIELRRDIACVAVLQLAGLAYGLATVFEARPVVLALEGQRFRVLRAIDLDETELAKASPEWQHLPWHGFLVVAARPPAGVEEQLKAIDMAMSGIDLGMRPELWLPAALTGYAIAEAARPIEELARKYPARTRELQRHLQQTGVAPDRLRYLPLLARQTDWLALVDAGSGRIAGYAPFDGF